MRMSFLPTALAAVALSASPAAAQQYAVTNNVYVVVQDKTAPAPSAPAVVCTDKGCFPVGSPVFGAPTFAAGSACAGGNCPAPAQVRTRGPGLFGGRGLFRR